ncbi:hypothetical protein ACFE04_014000 [Oxalis oulophora]
MALQEKLDKFNKQQQRCHSTFTSIAAKSFSTSTSSLPPKYTPVNAPLVVKDPAPPVKFSSDTARLQQINSIRKAPVGAQIKRVIDLLFERRQAFLPEQINQTCYVDVKGNKAVFDSLRNNPKVHYDGKRFSYKPKHYLADKSELLVLIRKFVEGIAVADLKDSYKNVMGDLQALKAAGQIWLLPSSDPQEDVAYPDDPRISIKVDNDLKEFFRSIELPRDMLDMEKELRKNGMKPATNSAKRRAAAQIKGISNKPKQKKIKKREITKRTKLTNVHLPELFRI